MLVRRRLCAKSLFLRPLQAFEFHQNCPLCLPSQLPYSNPLFTAASFSPPSIPPSPRVLQTTADLPFLHPASLISIHDNGGLSFPMKCSCILRCCSRSQVILGHYNKKKKKITKVSQQPLIPKSAVNACVWMSQREVQKFCLNSAATSLCSGFSVCPQILCLTAFLKMNIFISRMTLFSFIYNIERHSNLKEVLRIFGNRNVKEPLVLLTVTPVLSSFHHF